MNLDSKNQATVTKLFFTAKLVSDPTKRQISCVRLDTSGKLRLWPWPRYQTDNVFLYNSVFNYPGSWADYAERTKSGWWKITIFVISPLVLDWHLHTYTTHTHTQTPNLLPPPTLLHRLLGIQSDHFFSLCAHQSFVAFIPVQKIKKPCFSFIMYLSLFLPSFPCSLPSSLLSFSIHNGSLCIIRKTRWTQPQPSYWSHVRRRLTTY